MKLMKPISLCLVQIGNKGIELVNSYPNVLPTEVTNQIILKSMPFGAKHGDFITTNSGQKFPDMFSKSPEKMKGTI